MDVPVPGHLEQFLSFMENELAQGGINTLVLMVYYNYKFESRSRIQGRLIPQINLLGHQSWAG